MGNIKEIQQIKVLIAKGKTTGFLTIDEVNKALPAEASSPEQILSHLIIGTGNTPPRQPGYHDPQGNHQ